MSVGPKIQIRNGTADFLIFTGQAGEDGIEVRVADETVWLSQKLQQEGARQVMGTIGSTRIAHFFHAVSCAHIKEFGMIASNNTPQAYPVACHRDAQTGGFIFSGPAHAL